ncbi:MAG TPA: hypothetical protein ENI57_04770 [Ignavibacteria bacterium]|nr:hypothetical protein [Ignavibacteria bacterium]
MVNVFAFTFYYLILSLSVSNGLRQAGLPTKLKIRLRQASLPMKLKIKLWLVSLLLYSNFYCRCSPPASVGTGLRWMVNFEI